VNTTTHLSVRVAAVALAWLAAVAPAFAQTDISGDWAVSVDSPQGATTIDASFKQVGEAVTGTVTSPMGSVDFKGTLVKDLLSVTYTLDVQGNTLDIVMSGKVAGEAMDGTLAIAGLGEIPWSAKRKPAGSAVPAAAAAAAAPATSAPAAAGAAGDATGKWDIVLSVGGAGEFPMTADFKQTGEAITGTLTSQAGEVPVTGTMKGRSLNLAFTAPTPQGNLDITMSGELGADDAFVGKTSISGLGEADWTGKRAR
jgi:hypothetical protein